MLRNVELKISVNDALTAKTDLLEFVGASRRAAARATFLPVKLLSRKTRGKVRSSLS